MRARHPGRSASSLWFFEVARGHPIRLRAADEAQQQDQDHRADEGHDDGADQAAADADAEAAEEPPTEEGADDADDHVADDAVAAALHHLSCQPTGDEPYEKKPDQAHP